MVSSLQQSVISALLTADRPADPALLDGDRVLSHGDLAALVRARAAELPFTDRRVVALAGPSGLEWVLSYLALLEAGHVPVLIGDRAERLLDRWRPAGVLTAGADGYDLEVDASAPVPELHSDLALLLSTSGSTGSPRLVRLSHRNLVSNAHAVAASLGLGAADRGITSLPLHYCYGLSVLHSHLAVGASVVTTTASVMDPCFAAAVERHGVTSLAGVPHSFDLLETAGPDRVLGPSIRLLTQAGGRMDPGALARWRERAAARQIDLVVMYGQTEATARMAYLPPALAAACPQAVGVAIPGGELRIDPMSGVDHGIGEIVYRGPNVMLGYAEEPADLALGATLTELRTGDLGRIDSEHGVLEVVGRRSRFVKPFGLRVDLDGVEDQLRGVLGEVAVAGDDDRLVIGAPRQDPVTVQELVHDITGLPTARIVVVADVPRTRTGKPDYASLLAAADSVVDPGAGAAEGLPSTIVAGILGLHDLRPADTFTSAGGDSLSYIEASVRLEEVIGRLPEDWQHLSMAELDALDRTPGARRIDTTAVLRAVGICAVVATHMHLLWFPGGAHLLLAVVGYNLSRFQLGLERASERLRAWARTISRIVVPTLVWIVVAHRVTGDYEATNLLFVNNYLGPRGHVRGLWHFWFIEAIVQLGLVLMLVLAVPVVRRIERRAPYRFVLALLAVAVGLRFLTIGGIDDPFNLRFRTHGVAAFFVLGLLIHRSGTVPQKVLTSVLCVVTVVGFFGQPQREAFIVAGLLLLTWARSIPLPRLAVAVVGAVASASMWILISHFQVWPHLASRLPLELAYLITVAVGIVLWRSTTAAPQLARRLLLLTRATIDRPAPLDPIAPR